MSKVIFISLTDVSFEKCLRSKNVDGELRMAWCGGRKFDAEYFVFDLRHSS